MVIRSSADFWPDDTLPPLLTDLDRVAGRPHHVLLTSRIRFFSANVDLGTVAYTGEALRYPSPFGLFVTCGASSRTTFLLRLLSCTTSEYLAPRRRCFPQRRGPIPFPMAL